ncbi:MAG: hypothetical protein ACXWCX_28665, partial [Burkholderiales bacterium]
RTALAHAAGDVIRTQGDLPALQAIELAPDLAVGASDPRCRRGSMRDPIGQQRWHGALREIGERTYSGA